MPNETILVVDDSPINLKLAQLLLRASGFQVDIAGGAVEALMKLRVLRPDMILMDVQMPDTDGLELTRILRSDDSMNEVRIVALSAGDTDADEEMARSAGCQGYIRKPINPSTFGATVRKHMSYLTAPSSVHIRV